MQALGASRRWPRKAITPAGIRALTIWARTRAGRPLIVAVRQIDGRDWLIIGARGMDAAEVAEFEEWEARRER